MKNLFLDANIWLSLYSKSVDDLSRFNQLEGLLNGEIKLWASKQVIDEVKRNRENKLKGVTAILNLPTLQYNNVQRGYDEKNNLDKEYQKLRCKFKAWKDKIDCDVKNKNLLADELIERIFDGLPKDDTDYSVLTKNAFIRYKSGNPPGKNDSLGDAINWEWLLQVVPNGENLYFVSADNDYCSSLYDNEFNMFLQSEWAEKKNAKIIFYKSLNTFLQNNYKVEDSKENFENSESIDNVDNCDGEGNNKEIDGAERNALLQQLNVSGSFSSTHNIIYMLRKTAGQWSTEQIVQLCDAAQNNNQVGLILDDFDVRELYRSVLRNVSYISLPEGSVKCVMEKVFSKNNDSYVIDGGTF